LLCRLYFNAHLFAPFKNSRFVNHDLLEKYWYVGGVRIEDNLLITKDGFDNLTPARLPKTVEEIEAVTARA
jgi:Xaa-Pro dipeptidase